MHNVRHQASLFSNPASKWQTMGNIVLVTAAFVFVSAVTFGLFP